MNHPPAAGPVSQPRTVLLLCDDDPWNADTVIDHIQALRRHSRHRVMPINPKRAVGRLDLAPFDVLAIHYSVSVAGGSLPETLARAIARHPGLKLQFLQDEYRWVDRATAAIRSMGVGVLFSCLPPDQMQTVYGERLPGVRLEPSLTGYVPDRLVRVRSPSPGERRVDVGYRGRELPLWLGRLAYDKVAIAKGVIERAPAHGLVTDISWREEDRIYGTAWGRFLSSCKSTLATGSGASIIDFDGSIESAAREHLRAHPEAGFEGLHAAVLAPHEGNVRMEVVSPRIFEAIAWRTALVLFPAWYSGMLEPWRHYIPLERDFSNFGQVAKALRDNDLLAELTERAHVDVVASGRYGDRVLAAAFDAAVELAQPASGRSLAAYRITRLRTVVPGPSRLLRGGGAMALMLRAPVLWRLRSRLEGRPVIARLLRDPMAYSGKGVTALAAALSTPAGRRALWIWARDRALRRRVPLDILLEDLAELRLAASLSGLRLRFGDGLLTMVSGGPQRHPGLQDGAAVAAAIRGGRVSRVLWDHRKSHPPGAGGAPRSGTGLQIGQGGIQRFPALAAIAEVSPMALADLLEPLLSPAARRDVQRLGYDGRSR